MSSSPAGNDEAAAARFAHQAAEYSFPYHWLPRARDGRWTIGRTLGWGLEYLAVLESTKSLVLSTKPARVLDFGCGDGRLSHELVDAGVDDVVGVDLVERAIAFADAFNTGRTTRARFYCEPVQSLPEHDFDAVVAMEVFEHLPLTDIGPVLEAIWRRMAPGGALVVSVPTTNVDLIAKHERHYTAELLRQHLQPYFTIEELRYVHRECVSSRFVRRLMTNRFVQLEAPRFSRFVVSVYQRRYWHAGPADGAHLIARLSRAELPAPN